MKNKKMMNKLGVSLPEISIAVLIFALCAIPLYYAIAYGSKEEIKMEKNAIANKILESFRDEIKDLDYDTAVTFGNFSDGSGLPPETLKVYEQAKNYKDFKVSCESTPNNEMGDIESTTFKAKVTWDGLEFPKELSFKKVKTNL